MNAPPAMIIARLAMVIAAALGGMTASAQELDIAPSTGKGSPDGPAIIAGVDGKLGERTTATAAFTRQNGSAITGGLAQLEWKLDQAFNLLGAAGYAVRERTPVSHAVDLRAGFTWLRALSDRIKIKNQTMVEALIQDAPTGNLVRFRSRFELGYQLVEPSAEKPILFASIEPIADQQHRGIQQVRLQTGLMATLGRLAGQLYYRREEIVLGPEGSRNALFLRAIVRVGPVSEGE